ncbi:hypothetical protein EJB05_24937, partial [Eragrostis curvula]
MDCFSRAMALAITHAACVALPVALVYAIVRVASSAPQQHVLATAALSVVLVLWVSTCSVYYVRVCAKLVPWSALGRCFLCRRRGRQLPGAGAGAMPQYALGRQGLGLKRDRVDPPNRRNLTLNLRSNRFGSTLFGRGLNRGAARSTPRGGESILLDSGNPAHRRRRPAPRSRRLVVSISMAETCFPFTNGSRLLRFGGRALTALLSVTTMPGADDADSTGSSGIAGIFVSKMDAVAWRWQEANELAVGHDELRSSRSL